MSECSQDGNLVDSNDTDDLRIEQLLGFGRRNVQSVVQRGVVSFFAFGRSTDGMYVHQSQIYIITLQQHIYTQSIYSRAESQDQSRRNKLW